MKYKNGDIVNTDIFYALLNHWHSGPPNRFKSIDGTVIGAENCSGVFYKLSIALHEKFDEDKVYYFTDKNQSGITGKKLNSFIDKSMPLQHMWFHENNVYINDEEKQLPEDSLSFFRRTMFGYGY